MFDIKLQLSNEQFTALCAVIRRDAVTIYGKLVNIERMILEMDARIARIKADVEQLSSVTASVKALVSGVVVELRDVKAKLAEAQANDETVDLSLLDNVADVLEANVNELTGVVIANTPAAPAPAEPAPVEEPAPAEPAPAEEPAAPAE